MSLSVFFFYLNTFLRWTPCNCIVSRGCIILSLLQEEIDKRIDAANPQEYFIVSLYQMDIERVRYSLARYLRTRILKIERNIEYIVSDIDIMDRLSMQEKVYATKLNSLNNSHFEDNVSGRLQSESAKEFYEVSENRQNNSQPSMQVSKLNHHINHVSASTVIRQLSNEIAFLSIRSIQPP